MATMAEPRRALAGDDKFFLTMAIVMAVTIAAGFLVQLAAGRSSFLSPPLVHAHALTFFGWVVLYVTQNVLVVRGRQDLHRLLGWIGAGWMVAMIVLGTAVTVAMVRRGAVPFFFAPGYFLVMDPLLVLTFAGLTTAAIVNRRRTDWHRRLHYCGMAFLTAPGLARLLPMPFMIPWAGEIAFAATLIFPAVGVIRDLRSDGRVHPAWWWGIGTMGAMIVVMDLAAYGGPGEAIYHAVVAGSPGAAIAPLAYPPSPLP